MYALSQRTTQALESLSDQEILKAVFVLGLQEDQKQVFARAVEDCVQGYAKVVNKLMSANNQANLKRTILKKRNYRPNALDSTMRKLLTEPQATPYDDFRFILTRKSSNRATRACLLLDTTN
ncbi:MAG: hypothetical protein ABIO31_02770 [Candidatus Nitrotoga sp.]